MTSRVELVGTQSLDYTPFDLPSTITIGASVAQFDYSADEERVVRRDPDRTRYTVGGLYERVTGLAGDTLEQRFRLYAGSRQIAEVVRDASGEKTLYFHAGALGSVDTVSQSNGSALTQAFDPFGAPIDPANPALTRSGFTGHQHDNDLGLIDMKGRIYDPFAGRFMSADPISQAPFWSQGLNRYAYVFNDPVNLIDPTGFVGGDDAYRGAASYLRLGYGEGLGGSIAGGFGGALFNVGASLITGGYGGGSAGSVRTVTPSAAPAAVGQGQSSMNAVAQNRGGVGAVQPNFELPPKGPDLRRADIWIEGASGLEPGPHQSIAVGDPLGDYKSYSFAVNDFGSVYEVVTPGGPIQKYMRTTPEQDREALELIESARNRDDNRCYTPSTRVIRTAKKNSRCCKSILA